MSEVDPAITRKAVASPRAAGVLLVSSAVVFWAAEFITAAAWTDPPYSYTYHYVSNLGGRGPVTTLHQEMNSPLSWVMNTGFFSFGIILAVGVVALRGLSGWRRIASWVLVLLIAGGGVLLALNPGDGKEAAGQVDYHAIGAMASILSGNVLTVLLGRQHRALGIAPPAGRAMVALGALGLIAIPVYLSVAGSAFELIGLFERLAIYPFFLGQSIAGVSLWRRAGRQRAAIEDTDRLARPPVGDPARTG